MPWVTLPNVTATPETETSALAVPERLPSRFEGLSETPFDQFDTAQLALLNGWLESALADWPSSANTARVSSSGRTAYCLASHLGPGTPDGMGTD